MFIPYSEISNKSRIWIYQSNKKITINQKNEINNQLLDYCNNWNTHGQPVVSSFKIYDWFICLFALEDVDPISGCSIDSSVLLIKSIGHKYKLDFFNRENIIFFNEGVSTILPLSEFKLMIHPDIIVYNNMVQNKKEFKNKWMVKVKDTWLCRFLKNLK